MKSIKKIFCFILNIFWIFILADTFFEENFSFKVSIFCFVFIVGIITAMIAKSKNLNSKFPLWFFYGAFVPIISWFEVASANSKKTNGIIFSLLCVVIFLSCFSLLHDSKTPQTLNIIAQEKENQEYKPTPQKYSEKVLEKRRWVMENIIIGTEWNFFEMVKKFGECEQYDPETGNPKILQMFYFPEIDMSFMVNLLEGKIQVWRTGRAYK